MSSVGQNKYYLNTTNVLFDTMEETIGARIAVSLVRAGMSQKELAAHMNVTTRTIKRWIDDESEVLEKYRQKLSNVLGVTGEWLFYGVEKPTNTPQLITMPDASEEELRRAMSQLPWACALVDEDWRFYFATDSYIDAYGLEDQTPIEGKTIGEIMPDVQAELTPGITAILDRGEAYHTPEPQPWPRDDGKLWELVYSLYPWRYDGKRGTIIECRSIRVDGVERIPQTRYVQGNVQVNTPSVISKNTYKQEQKTPVYRNMDSSTLEDKIFSLVDLDAMKQLIDAGAGDVQEGFYSTFRRIHEDGEVYRFTVRVDVEREKPRRTSSKPQKDEGPPHEE